MIRDWFAAVYNDAQRVARNITLTMLSTHKAVPVGPNKVAFVWANWSLAVLFFFLKSPVREKKQKKCGNMHTKSIYRTAMTHSSVSSSHPMCVAS